MNGSHRWTNPFGLGTRTRVAPTSRPTPRVGVALDRRGESFCELLPYRYSRKLHALLVCLELNPDLEQYTIMFYIVRARESENGQITLQVSDPSYPVAIVDLIKLHEIWRQQHGYKRIKDENDEYASGKRKGAIQYELPTICVNIDNTPPKVRVPLLRTQPRIEIGFVNGMHRLDYFYRQGARILPVHTTTEASKRDVEHHVGASEVLIAQELIDRPKNPF